MKRVALIGFGKAAARAHLPALTQHGGFELAAVVDPSASRRRAAREALGPIAVYESLECCLREQAIDVADIVTPPRWHAPLAREALAHGLHVLCEKPLALDRRELGELKALSERHRRCLFAVHNWVHAPAYVRMRRLIEGGSLGEPLFFELVTLRANPCRGLRVEGTQPGDWRLDPRIAGGGVLLDHGWHALSLLLALAGAEPMGAAGHIERRADPGSPVEDTASVRVEFPGAFGLIYVTWAASRRSNTARVSATKGEICMNDCEIEWGPLGGRRERAGFAEAVSAGSYHPTWMVPLLDAFLLELNDPSRRGANLRQAELCGQIIFGVYDSCREALGQRPPLSAAALPGSPR